MHASAKLNLFFGVPNLGAEMLPRHLAYLESFMARRPMNMFFPLSVTISTVATALLAQRARTQATPSNHRLYDAGDDDGAGGGRALVPGRADERQRALGRVVAKSAGRFRPTLETSSPRSNRG